MRKTLIALMLALAIGLGVALPGSDPPSASADERVLIRFSCQFQSDLGPIVISHDLIPGKVETTLLIGDFIQMCHALPRGTLLPPEVIRTEG